MGRESHPWSVVCADCRSINGCHTVGGSTERGNVNKRAPVCGSPAAAPGCRQCVRNSGVGQETPSSAPSPGLKARPRDEQVRETAAWGRGACLTGECPQSKPATRPRGHEANKQDAHKRTGARERKTHTNWELTGRWGITRAGIRIKSAEVDQYSSASLARSMNSTKGATSMREVEHYLYVMNAFTPYFLFSVLQETASLCVPLSFI